MIIMLSESLLSLGTENQIAENVAFIQEKEYFQSCNDYDTHFT